VWFGRYARGQRDRQTHDTQTCSLQYFATAAADEVITGNKNGNWNCLTRTGRNALSVTPNLNRHGSQYQRGNWWVSWMLSKDRCGDIISCCWCCYCWLTISAADSRVIRICWFAALAEMSDCYAASEELTVSLTSGAVSFDVLLWDFLLVKYRPKTTRKCGFSLDQGILLYRTSLILLREEVCRRLLLMALVDIDRSILVLHGLWCAVSMLRHPVWLLFWFSHDIITEV